MLCLCGALAVSSTALAEYQQGDATEAAMEKDSGYQTGKASGTAAESGTSALGTSGAVLVGAAVAAAVVIGIHMANDQAND
ncbi:MULTISPECIES: hypothetical protein [Thiomicrorhabdus]|uniref:Uncharacterized protein n=1 Tax=Thiomicrorhabdus heinhorstiae TaxID=2748010 RepID=A0ABS0BZJ5_9GAMM|nr:MULTISPECIES: hypothetical protein [Thiomicrorhabdus]MBF6058884.1 hypothetical protein [Thiomicrorhabdus heinhorstiae]